MINDPIISIVIPCYNIGEYIEKCISSLKKQHPTIRDVEYIFINDGSNDNTIDFIKRFEQSDKRVIVINKNNCGVSSARNDGIARAKGKYIFFLDGDDFLEDNFCLQIENAVTSLDENNIPDIILFNSNIVFPDGSTKRWTTNVKRGIYSYNDFISSTNELPISFKIYRKEFLVHNNIVYDADLKVGEVFTFFVHCLTFCKQIMVLDEFLLNYVIRKSSAMHSIKVKNDATIIKTLSRLEEYALNKRNLINERPFKLSVFKSVNSFSFFKYIKLDYKDKNVLDFLNYVKKSKFSRYLRFFALKDKTISKEKIISIIILSCPVNISFLLIRFFYRLSIIRK